MDHDQQLLTEKEVGELYQKEIFDKNTERHEIRIKVDLNRETDRASGNIYDDEYNISIYLIQRTMKMLHTQSRA